MCAVSGFLPGVVAEEIELSDIESRGRESTGQRPESGQRISDFVRAQSPVTHGTSTKPSSPPQPAVVAVLSSQSPSLEETWIRRPFPFVI